MPVLKNSRHECFAQERAKGATAVDAYATAGYKRHDGNAARLSGNDRVIQRIKEIQGPAVKRAEAKIEASAEKTLREAARLAFSDIRNLFDENGHLKAVHELDDDTAAVVKKVKVTTLPGKKDEEPVHVTEIEFWSKIDGVKMLGQHYKIFGQDDEQDDPIKRFAELMLAAAARPLPLSEPMTPAMMAQNPSPRRQRAPVQIEDAVEEEVEP